MVKKFTGTTSTKKLKKCNKKEITLKLTPCPKKCRTCETKNSCNKTTDLCNSYHGTKCR